MLVIFIVDYTYFNDPSMNQRLKLLITQTIISFIAIVNLLLLAYFFFNVNKVRIWIECNNPLDLQIQLNKLNKFYKILAPSFALYSLLYYMMINVLQYEQLYPPHKAILVLSDTVIIICVPLFYAYISKLMFFFIIRRR